LVIALLFAFGGFWQVTSADQLYTIKDVLSSQMINASSTHTLTFKTPTGATTTAKTIIVTFPSGFDFTGIATTDLTLRHGTTTGLEITTTIAAAPGANIWGAVFSGASSTILTLTSPTSGSIGSGYVGPNEIVTLSYTAVHSINPPTAGPYSLAISGTFGDTGSVTLNILGNGQVSLTAKVQETLTFTISDTILGFGTLLSSAARYATADGLGSASDTGAHNIIVGTNATGGYTVTVAGTTLTSLTTPANTITAQTTATASTVGSEQFGLMAVATGGTGTVQAPYATASSFALNGGTFASALAATANTTYATHYIANIAPETQAGDYGTTLTYAVAANF
jgi:hypothetical protein